METLILGQIGLGPWGSNLARNFNELAHLKWICDIADTVESTVKTRFPTTKLTNQIDDLLTDPDVNAIIIATPVPTHAQLAKKALLAGKHVFVEKPMALDPNEAAELTNLAIDRNLTLMPGHLLLYHPGVIRLKKLLDSGTLGDVLYVYGNRQNLGTIRKDENALWSLGVHDLSVILHLLEEKPVEVWSRGSSFLKKNIEDVVFCYLRFPSGKVAHMHLSWLDPHKMRRMTVVGTQKMAVFDDMELDRKLTIYDKAAEQAVGTYGEWRTRTGDIQSPFVPNDEPLKLECKHFLNLVRGEGDRIKPAKDGLEVVRTLAKLQDSLENNAC